MNVRHLFVLFAVFAAALTIVGAANAQHFDILLARPAAGSQTVIGGADVDALAYDDVTRVFEAEMGDSGVDFFALEPGVNHPNLNNAVMAYPFSSAAGLQPGDVLRIFERDFELNGIADDLFYWNGVGAVSFAPASADFRVDGGDPLSSTTGVGGDFDDHPFLVVDSNSQPGIYLASVYGVVDGFDPSDPVYIVFATGEEFEVAHELAAEYVHRALVVPEPATLALGGVACAAIAATACRKRWFVQRFD
jgi:hypothetical protein